MNKYTVLLLSGFAVFSIAVPVAFAALQPIDYNHKTYYVVDGNNPDLNSGNRVCNSVGKKCVGYTALNNDVCKKAHPDAAVTSGVNGSKSGFYCNGAPQKGLACEKTLNTCAVCPACNVNLDCDTQVGDQYAQTYVECSGGDAAAPVAVAEAKAVVKGPNWLVRLWDSILSIFRRKVVVTQTQVVTQNQIVVTGMDATVDANIGVYPGQVVCEFYQANTPGTGVTSNKKLVTCGGYKAADTFCTTAMQSRFAKALKCEDNGIIICGNPCNPPEYQVPIKQCAFDNDRPRGNQAPPLRFCDTKTVKIPAATGTKTAGQVCAHGGECTSGNCLGQPSDSGIKYFCSCDPFKLDFTCNK